MQHLQEYWGRMLSDHPEHPLAGEPWKWEQAVPICLWGDEGTQNRTSWMLSSWYLGQISLQRIGIMLSLFDKVPSILDPKSYKP